MNTSQGLITSTNQAIIDFITSEWLIIEVITPPPTPPGTSMGTFRFLKDHYIGGEYILAGDIREMFTPWSPTADVEPLDATAVPYFYNHGPTLGGVIRTQFSNRLITKPVTYWTGVGPNQWALTGLGSNLPPITAILARVEDKEP